MADLAALESRITVIEDIEAIKRLKAKYLRCIDMKLWDEVVECFTEDATTDYTDGQYQQQGRDQIVGFLKKGLGRDHFFGFHQCHHPEIEMTGKTTARGVWSLHYYMIDSREKKGYQCGAFYKDEYVKVNGTWKMKSTGYTRVFEENWDRNETKGLNLVAVGDFPLSVDSV